MTVEQPSTKTSSTRVGNTTPSVPDSIIGDVDDESVVGELRRIVFTGTLWFAAAIIASGIPLAGLLAAGWRPADLPMASEITWWVGAALALIGIAGFGWAGCPVLAWALPIAERQKSICIRGGIGLYLLGTVAAGVAILSVPA